MLRASEAGGVPGTGEEVAQTGLFRVGGLEGIAPPRGRPLAAFGGGHDGIEAAFLDASRGDARDLDPGLHRAREPAGVRTAREEGTDPAFDVAAVLGEEHTDQRVHDFGANAGNAIVV